MAVTVAPAGKIVILSVVVLMPLPVADRPATPLAPRRTAQAGGNASNVRGAGIIGASPNNNRGKLTTGRAVAIGGGVVGLASVATGVAFALRSQDKWRQAQTGHCNELNQCNPEGLALAREASDAATVSNLSYDIATWMLGASVCFGSLRHPRTARAAGKRAPQPTLRGAGSLSLLSLPRIAPA
jgi:hypothetical protein